MVGSAPMSGERGVRHGWAAGAVVAMAVALVFPSLAAAAPACPPSATFPSVHSGTSDVAQLQCDDPGGTGLNYSLAADASHGQVFVGGDGSLSYASNYDYKGQDAWTVQVDDNEGGTASVHYTVQVTNQAPVCHDVDLGSVPRGQPAFGSPDCQDPDGDPIIQIVAGTPAHGTSDTSFGNLSYTPAPGFAGDDQFTYHAKDYVEDGANATAKVTVTNSAPICDTSFYGDQATLRTGKPITLHVYCYDLDGDPITVSKGASPAHGALGAFAFNSSSGLFDVTFTPTGSYTGADQFTFKASDG